MRVEDIALALGVIAGHDPRDPTSVRREVHDYLGNLHGDLHGVVIGLPKSFFYEHIREDVKDVVMSAVNNLKILGAESSRAQAQ